MPIPLDSLDRAATRATPTIVAKSLQEARTLGRKTAFLSHSHLDRTRAKGLQTLLAEQGWNVFIDWEHCTLDERPTKETAAWLQEAIVRCDWLLYLATPNSQKSRWCPWEIGYADGKKSAPSIVVVATKDSSGTSGSEYLNLYRQMSETTTGTLMMSEPGKVSTARVLREVSTTPSTRL